MKIYSADTWTMEELQEQVADAGRRVLVVPAADSKRAVLETFGEVLAFPEHYGVNLDALNDSLHDFADSISENGNAPVTLIWRVAAAFRGDRSFGIICEVLQDAGKVTAEIAKAAVTTGRAVRELVLERGLLSAEELDRILSADAMTRPGIAGRDNEREAERKR